MLHACVQKFDVTGNLEKFGILGATNKGLRGRLKAVRIKGRNKIHKPQVINLYAE